jgi:hypothetical protein
MRFVIATSAILAKSTLFVDAAAVSPPDDISQLLSRDQHHEEQEHIWDHLADHHAQQKTIRKKHPLINKTSQRYYAAVATAENVGPLKNKWNEDGIIECKPLSSPATVDSAADIGVLSCGMGKYCMESSVSSLGGVCMDSDSDSLVSNLPARRRQQVVGRLSVFEVADLFCNRPDTTGLVVECNCTVDFEAYSGEFSCNFGSTEDCPDFKAGCHYETTFPLCSTEKLVASMESKTSYSYTSCYTQSMPATGYSFTYCTEFGFTEETGPTCDMTVGDERCNSWYEALRSTLHLSVHSHLRFLTILASFCDEIPLSSQINIGGGETYGENCEVFDCTNTAINYAGDRCGSFSDPTLRSVSLVEYLYENFWPCEGGCNLCGEGGRMTSGLNNFTYSSQFFEEDVSFQCYNVQYNALTGAFIDGDYCNALPPIAEEPCGCGKVAQPTEAPVSSPVESPTDDSPVASPDSPTGDSSPPAASAMHRKNGVVTGLGLLIIFSAFWAF